MRTIFIPISQIRAQNNDHASTEIFQRGYERNSTSFFANIAAPQVDGCEYLADNELDFRAL